MCGSDSYFQSELSVNRVRAKNEIYSRCVRNQPQDECHGVGLKACQPGPLPFFLSHPNSQLKPIFAMQPLNPVTFF